MKINLSAWRDRREEGRAFWKPPTPRRRPKRDSGTPDLHAMHQAMQNMTIELQRQIDASRRREQEQQLTDLYLEATFDSLPDDVKRLVLTVIQKQNRLPADGLYGPRTKEVMFPKDGVRGPATIEALREFQRSRAVMKREDDWLSAEEAEEKYPIAEPLPRTSN